MEYRRLGRSGLQVSALSLGSWLTFGKQITDATADELMTFAYANGINFFDNAEGYAGGKSEIVMGEILQRKKWDRTSYLVSSKVFYGGKLPNQTGLSRKHVVEACNAALKRLQVDYLDLYFCHRPDPNTPIEETVWAMHHLIQQGKVLYWGTSEWSAREIITAFEVAEKHHLMPPAMEQPQYNMFNRQRVEEEYAPLFEEYKIGTTIFSPLASGILSGKYNKGFVEQTRLSIEGLEWLKEKTITTERIAVTQKLQQVAEELGITLAQLALAWCLKNPNVSSVILGASKVQQMEENIKAIAALQKLDHETLQKIKFILQGSESA